jgi:flagellin-like hook-associated protein FlgL
MDEITTSLQRIRTLAIQAQNGINSDDDRLALQKEVSALKLEMSRIAETTQFGKQNLLDGTYSAQFLVGANAGQNISVNLEASGGYGTTGLGLEDLSVSSVAGASAALSAIDAAIGVIDGKRADLGAIQNRFQATVRNLTNISENVSGARSRIRDTDFARATNQYYCSGAGESASSGSIIITGIIWSSAEGKLFQVFP